MTASDDRKGLIERILRKTRLFTDGKTPQAPVKTEKLELEFTPGEEPSEAMPPVKIIVGGVTTSSQAARRVKWDAMQARRKEEFQRGKKERSSGNVTVNVFNRYEGDADEDSNLSKAIGAHMMTAGLHSMATVKVKDGLIGGFGLTVDPSMPTGGIAIGGSGESVRVSGGGFADDPMIRALKASAKREAEAAAAEKEHATKKAHHVPVEEGFTNLIWEEMERFGKDTDEAHNVREVFGRVLKEMRTIAELHGTTLNEILENDPMSEEEKSAHQLALEALAKKITESWVNDEFVLEPTTFTVNSSLSLTVWKEDKGGYRKHPHIGGEEFTPVKAHVGAKGHLIISLKPNQPEPYNWMEMPLTECLVHLAGFQSHFVNNFGPDWAAINNAKAEAKQAADIEKFGTTYADFGSY